MCVWTEEFSKNFFVKLNIKRAAREQTSQLASANW